MAKYINKTVSLSDDEIDHLTDVATKRCEKKNLTKTWSKGTSKSDKNLHGHLLGVIGEYICAREYNGEFDSKIYGAEGDKHKPDVIIGNKKCEVKSTHYWPPILKITRRGELSQSTEEIFLCHINLKEKQCTIMGSISVNEFWNTCYIHDFRYGNRYCYVFTEPSILDYIEELNFTESI